FISVYTDQRDEENNEENEITHLPQINTGETLTKEKVEAIQHSTEPPPRYSEASLIKKLEELGIGRPSTYASTLATLSDRGYIIID
ncbi:DNA topoisomerase, partial [Bartonella sp. MR168JLCBS]|uniref:DNA topoisomerase n=1 Tax=Bartonella sp. MR168JLCBS TaxID=3243556 RepID=UPI0035D01972